MSPHLQALWGEVDEHDAEDGMKAYLRYHDLMLMLANAYEATLEEAAAVFAALSPSNDYKNNLRGAATMLAARAAGKDPMKVSSGTFGHAQARAALYMSGTRFLDHAKGLKTRAFYANIVDPTDPDPITVDGHMALAWSGEPGPIRNVRMTPKLYKQVASDIRAMAQKYSVLPHQMQAMLWFARKRTANSVYDPQFDMFDGESGAQKTVFKVSEIKLFGDKCN
jgi:hypothetical protein